MTELSEAAVAPAPAPSFWEDAIDIFVSPAGVFRRRANDTFWKPFLFVVIVMGVVGFATFNTLQPIFESEYARGVASQKMTEAQAAIGHDFFMKYAPFIFPLGLAIIMTILGFGTWLVAKFFGATTTLSQAFVVAAWAYFPRMLGAITGGVQGLMMDPSNLNSALAISLSPARFMDVNTANPVLYQMAGRFDLLIIWETILLAIGIYVTGKISKNAAIGFGITIFLAGSLQAIRAGILAM